MTHTQTEQLTESQAILLHCRACLTGQPILSAYVLLIGLVQAGRLQRLGLLQLQSKHLMLEAWATGQLE